MAKIDKSKYIEKLKKLDEQMEKILKNLEWTKDICVFAKHDKMGRPNWIARVLRIQGTIESMSQNCKEML